MMKTYRWNAARARTGSMIAAGLVGGGLLLTASGGIAAETSKRVEEEVRTALAPVVPALAPAAPLAPPVPPAPVAPAVVPEPVQLALLHPHPEPPAPPAAPVPPVPPVPPLHIDHDEISREVSEAMREARRDIAEAQREAARERQHALQEAAEHRREALREAEEARREGARARAEGAQARAEAARARAAAQAHVRSATWKCGQGTHNVSVEIDDAGDKQVVRCLGWSEKDKAEFRRTMIASLQSARASIKSIDHRYMPDHAREEALKSLDRQLERLREGK